MKINLYVNGRAVEGATIGRAWADGLTPWTVITFPHQELENGDILQFTYTTTVNQEA